MEVIVEGFLTGLAMIIFIGPVLFTLLQASLRFGFKGGMAVAIGIIISDVIAIAICALGAIPFFKDSYNQFWIALAGGILLLGMGFKYLWKPNYYQPEDFKIRKKEFTTLFIKGFLVNFVNPFVFLVWIGLIGYSQEKFPDDLILYLTLVLAGIFLTDSLKAYFAGRLKKFLAPQRLRRIYHVIGILLILFGFRLIYHAFVIS
ncbi:MAG: LysE family translocator [Flavobacteriales bacterium]|nr:LysE family translocator [Flavobacteriales bacterium]